MSRDGLAPDYFPHAHGRLVAQLARRLRAWDLATIEDAVQTAMLRALETWPRTGPPDLPDAWLYRVALNAALAQQRTTRRRDAIAATHGAELAAEAGEPPDAADGDAELVRMLLVCCHDSLAPRSRLILALKLMCGLSVPEIARRLLLGEDAVYKSLQRAEARLQREGRELLDAPWSILVPRLPALCAVLYAHFAAGFNALTGTRAIRAELCRDAIRLAETATRTPIGTPPELAALLALMHFGMARLPGRTGPDGELLLLHEQDRGRWDAGHVATGMDWLARAATGDSFSRYHAEAGIGAEHCRAASWAETRWDRILACHDLIAADATPLQKLDRAVAIAEWRGPEAGLAALDAITAPDRTKRSYLWLAVRAELVTRMGASDGAAALRQKAIAAAPTAALRDLIARAGDRHATG